MTKKHAPSFLFSVIVHLLVGFIFYSTYQAVLSVTKPKKKETLLCVSLKTYEPKEVPKKPLQKKVIEKKTKKISQKKRIHKKGIVHKTHKRIPIKKIIKKVPQIQKLLSKPKQEAIKKSVSVVQAVGEEREVAQKPQKQVLSPKKVYIEKHLKEITELLKENLYYPRRARKRGIVGTVVVHFEIQKDATVSQVKVLNSPSEILSRAALKTIQDLSGKFPKPQEKLFLKVPIQYQLK